MAKCARNASSSSSVGSFLTLNGDTAGKEADSGGPIENEGTVVGAAAAEGGAGAEDSSSATKFVRPFFRAKDSGVSPVD
jgi:hypothetical protein